MSTSDAGTTTAEGAARIAELEDLTREERARALSCNGERKKVPVGRAE